MSFSFSRVFVAIGTLLLIWRSHPHTRNVVDQNDLRWRSLQKRIQLSARQKAAKKRVEERREALKLVQQRRAEEQRQAVIKIQAAAKGKRDRVSDDSLICVQEEFYD